MKTNDVLNIVSDVSGIPVEDIVSKSRKKEVATLRHAVSFLLRKQGLTTSAIGKIINRDHATVICGSRKFKDLLSIKDNLAVSILNGYEKELLYNT